MREGVFSTAKPYRCPRRTISTCPPSLAIILKMTQDAPSDHDTPRVNGIPKPASASGAPQTFPEVCERLRGKVITFLAEQTDDEVLRNVQSQVRGSMRVIEEALRRYRWVLRQSEMGNIVNMLRKPQARTDIPLV